MDYREHILLRSVLHLRNLLDHSGCEQYAFFCGRYQLLANGKFIGRNDDA